MTEDLKKRARGRPQGGRFTIAKHVFLDQETAAKLTKLAQEHGLSESAVIRQLIARFQEGD